MSAIYGVIDLDNGQILPSEKNKLKKPIEKCVIDRFSENESQSVYMGCGIQYFTDTAKDELLPVFENNIFFDADVVLDNRDEIIDALSLDKELKNKPDGTIMFEALKKDFNKALDVMLGVYSFVYYDKEKKQCTIGIDATGNRCIYYRQTGSKIFFSSLLKSLSQQNPKAKINPVWMYSFLSIDFIPMFDETENTPYKSVYRVAPGHIVTFSPSKVSKRKYWDPVKNVRKLKNKGDIFYKDEFRKLWDNCVKSTLRSSSKISILLSGGFDSTAVLAVAAKELEKQGRDIYSYTSIPSEKEIHNVSDSTMPDESQMVLKTKEYFPNLKCSFINLSGKDSWSQYPEHMKIMEMPYKSVQNSLWLYESMETAYKNGSRIMLTGSYGNTTISYTNVRLMLWDLLSHGKFISFFKQLSSFGKANGFSRKAAIMDVLLSRFKSVTHKFDLDETLRKSYVKKENLTEENIRNMTVMDKFNNDINKNRKGILSAKASIYAFRQIGELTTKYSLFSGVLQRDPTIDKRMIEFCIALPLTQYDRDGVQRRLVREYMADIIPPHVLDCRKLGQQSADMREKLEPHFQEYKEQWLTVYKNNMSSEFADCKKAMADLEKIKSVYDVSSFDLTRHMYTVALLLFCSENS